MFVRNLGLFKGFPYYPDLLIVCWCFSLFKGLSLYLGVLGVIGEIIQCPWWTMSFVHNSSKRLPPI